MRRRDIQIRVAMLVCATLAMTFQGEAHARRCADNLRTPGKMKELIDTLSPRWDTVVVTTTKTDFLDWCRVGTKTDVVTTTNGVVTNTQTSTMYGPSDCFAGNILRGAMVTKVQQTGMREIFAPGGECKGCHQLKQDRYVSCSACHTKGNLFAEDYPDWLNFSTRESLMKAAYYSPGKSKAEASLERAKDGTMPPGAAPHSTDRFDGEQVSWCEEIQDVFAAWIAAGYPQ